MPRVHQPNELREVFGRSGDVSLQFEAGITTIQLVGEVDLETRPELDAVCALAIDYGAPVRVDLHEVTFIDSCGVSFIARLVGAGYAEGWKPVLVGARPRVIEVIAMAGLRDAVTLTEPAARDGVRPG